MLRLFVFALALSTILASRAYEPSDDLDEINDSSYEEDLDMMTAPKFSVPQGVTLKSVKCRGDYLYQQFRVSWTGSIPRGSQFLAYDSKGEMVSSGAAICGAWIDIYDGKLKPGFCAATGKLDIADDLFYIQKPGVYNLFYQELYDVKKGYLRRPGVKIGTFSITDTKCSTPAVKVGSSSEGSNEEEQNQSVTASSSSTSPACSARKGLCTHIPNCIGAYFTHPFGCTAGTVCCDGKIRT